jgi:hypothetical protein
VNRVNFQQKARMLDLISVLCSLDGGERRVRHDS